MTTSHKDISTLSGGTDCELTVELLPWLLNGTLADDERREVRDHLSSCAGCRQELQETARAWDLVTRHVPSLALAEYSQGLETSSMDRERLERHLALCPSCREELEQALSADEIDVASGRSQRARRRRWRQSRGGARPARRRVLVAAASLLLILLSGALILNQVAKDKPEATHQAEAVLVDGPAPRRAHLDRGQPLSPPNTAAIHASGFETGDMSGWIQAAPDTTPIQPVSHDSI